jgi:hypothetical protein
MISAKIDAGKLQRKFLNLRKSIDDSVDRQYKRKVLKMFNDLVRHSPQWSGDFASNWNITHDKTGKAYTKYAFKGNTPKNAARQMGDMQAIATPIARANAIRFGYKDIVYFSNNTPISFDGRSNTVTTVNALDGINPQPYPKIILPITVKVRPENLVDGRLGLISYIRRRYNK